MVLRTQQPSHAQGGLVDQCDEFLSVDFSIKISGTWPWPLKREGKVAEHNLANYIWLVVGPPLWKIWTSIGNVIPYRWEKCSKPPTRISFVVVDIYYCRRGTPIKNWGGQIKEWDMEVTNRNMGSPCKSLPQNWGDLDWLSKFVFRKNMLFDLPDRRLYFIEAVFKSISGQQK